MKKLNKLSIVKVISIPIISVALGIAFINATSGVSTITAENLKTIQTKLSSINGSKFNETIASLKQFKFHNTNGQLQVNLSTQEAANKVDVPNYKVVSINSQNYIVKTDAPIAGEAHIAIQTKLSSINGSVITSSNTIVGLDGLKFDKGANDKLQVNLSTQGNANKVNVPNYKVVSINSDNYIVKTDAPIAGDVLTAIQTKLSSINGPVITSSDTIVGLDGLKFYTTNKGQLQVNLSTQGNANKVDILNYKVVVTKDGENYIVDIKNKLSDIILSKAITELKKKNGDKINGIKITTTNFEFFVDRTNKKITHIKLIVGNDQNKTEINENNTQDYKLVGANNDLYLVFKYVKLKGDVLVFATSKLKDDTKIRLNKDKETFNLDDFTFGYLERIYQIHTVQLTGYDTTKSNDIKLKKQVVSFDRSNSFIIDYSTKLKSSILNKIINYIEQNKKITLESLEKKIIGLKFYNDNKQLKVKLSAQIGKEVNVTNYKVIKVYEENYLINITKKIQDEILQYISTKIKNKKFTKIQDDLSENFNVIKNDNGEILITLKSNDKNISETTSILPSLKVNSSGNIIKSTNKTSKKQSKKISKAIIISIAVGVAVPVIGIIALIIYFSKKKKK